VRDALAAGVSETGCTVHLATLEMDAGPILAQAVVPVLPGDTEATLHERIKVVERTLYPATVAWALGELQTGRAIEPPARLAEREGAAVGVGAGVPRGDGRERGEGVDEEMTS
jgi:methionyl-tRNA formyltransferase